jgi:hypothetical protein
MIRPSGMATELKILLMHSIADAVVQTGRIKSADKQTINEEVNKLRKELVLKDDDFEYLAYLVQRKLNAASKPVASTRPRKARTQRPEIEWRVLPGGVIPTWGANMAGD